MTDKYAVIGNPIAHSKSPQIHRMFAEQTGQVISYEAILAPLDGFIETVEQLRKEGYKGCSVTVPFKFEAFSLVCTPQDTLSLQGICSQAATNAHAANTLTFHKNFVNGDNTDGIGLVRDIQQNFHIPLKGKSILLMGAGGAAFGVLQSILHEHPKKLTIANRTLEKADKLHQLYAHLSQSELSTCTYPDLSGSFDIIINATSVGLSDIEIPLPSTIFAPDALAYDMMYGRETPFMKFSREHHAQVADGLGMLIEQAAEAFFIWRSVRPDTSQVIAALQSSEKVNLEQD